MFIGWEKCGLNHNNLNLPTQIQSNFIATLHTNFYEVKTPFYPESRKDKTHYGKTPYCQCLNLTFQCCEAHRLNPPWPPLWSQKSQRRISKLGMTRYHFVIWTDPLKKEKKDQCTLNLGTDNLASLELLCLIKCLLHRSLLQLIRYQHSPECDLHLQLYL